MKDIMRPKSNEGRGVYLAIEGIDGVGKTTQIHALCDAFPQAVVTKEPGGSELGQRIREMVLASHDYTPRAEMLLFMADRAEHVEKVIRPNRERLIVSDRSLISGLAYADPAFDYGFLLQLGRFATDGMMPDRCVILQIDETSLEARLGTRTPDGIESRGGAYLMGIQQRMKEAADALDIPTLILDATLPEETITQAIKEFIQ